VVISPPKAWRSALLCRRVRGSGCAGAHGVECRADQMWARSSCTSATVPNLQGGARRSIVCFSQVSWERILSNFIPIVGVWQRTRPAGHSQVWLWNALIELTIR
jgi:hypothetical protein